MPAEISVALLGLTKHTPLSDQEVPDNLLLGFCYMHQSLRATLCKPAANRDL